MYEQERKILHNWFDVSTTIVMISRFKMALNDPETSHGEFYESVDNTIKTFFADFGAEPEREKVMALIIMANYHHYLCEQACNRELSSYEEKLQDEIEKYAAEMVTTWGWNVKGVYYQHDPRGRTMGIILPSGRYNTWGGESWRLPLPV